MEHKKRIGETRFLLKAPKEKGLEQIFLEVSAKSKRAVALYKKLGFEIYETSPKNMKY